MTPKNCLEKIKVQFLEVTVHVHGQEDNVSKLIYELNKAHQNPSKHFFFFPINKVILKICTEM